MTYVMVDPSNTHRRSLTPFVLAGALPFLLLPLPGPAFDPALTLIGAVLTAAVALGAARAPWNTLSDWWTVVPVVGYLLAVAILREAGGGNVSGLGPLVILPALAVALMSTRRVLPVAVAGAALVYWIPIPLDETAYPASGWRIGLLLACMSALLGVAIHRLRDRLAEQAESLRVLALQDELTELPNRRAWGQSIDATLARAARDNSPICVAILDIDGFKAVNDSGGHAAGDGLLLRLSKVWFDTLRRSDVLARLGGDEFGILMPGIQFDDALIVVERLRARTEGVTCSIGMTQWDGEESGDALLVRADRLLYDAKRQGRNRVGAEPVTPKLSHR